MVTLWDEAFERIRRAHASGRMAHAYLLVSPLHGEIRRLTGRILSLLFCGSEKDRPCGQCPGCRLPILGGHPDVRILEPKLKSRATAIEDIRDLIRSLQQTAYEGGWKAAVLWQADRMTDQAANALLKQLEEPPSRTLFLLQTDRPESLLPTVRSRCQTLRFPLETSEEMKRWMEEVADLMTHYNARDFFSVWKAYARVGDILERWKQAVQKEVEAENEGLSEKGDREIIEARIQSRYREGRWLFLMALLAWQRDLLSAVFGLDPSRWLYRNRAEDIRRQAQGLSFQEILRRLEAVETMNDRLEQNFNEAAVWEAGLAALIAPATSS